VNQHSKKDQDRFVCFNCFLTLLMCLFNLCQITCRNNCSSNLLSLNLGCWTRVQLNGKRYLVSCKSIKSIWTKHLIWEIYCLFYNKTLIWNFCKRKISLFKIELDLGPASEVLRYFTSHLLIFSRYGYVFFWRCYLVLFSIFETIIF
jgi:hypothetical protein